MVINLNADCSPYICIAILQNNLKHYIMRQEVLKNLKCGDYFTLSTKDIVSSSSVWIRGNYVRSLKKFSCINFNDSCKERFLSGDRFVNIDFDF